MKQLGASFAQFEANDRRGTKSETLLIMYQRRNLFLCNEFIEQFLLINHHF